MENVLSTKWNPVFHRFRLKQDLYLGFLWEVIKHAIDAIEAIDAIDAIIK